MATANVTKHAIHELNLSMNILKRYIGKKGLSDKFFTYETAPCAICSIVINAESYFVPVV